MPARSKSSGAAVKKGSRSAGRRARRKPHAEARITVTFRHVSPTPALAQYAERKLGRIAKFLKRETEAHVILSVDKYRHMGEVTVKSGRFVMTAQEEDKDLYSVIDLLAAKVQRQVKKHVEKLEARKVRSPSAAEILSEPEETVAGAQSNESTSGNQ